jgi:hypothetical protein
MTHEQIAAWAAAMMDRAAENFQREGRLQPVALLLVTADPHTGAPYPPEKVGMLTVIPESLAREANKDRYAAAIAEAARAGRAVAVLSLAEVWLTTIKPGAEPQRLETLIATLETPDGVLLWRADIERPSAGPPTCTPFVSAPDRMSMQGRFTGLLGTNWN